jgi:phytoene dehydrogenase-like protein
MNVALSSCRTSRAMPGTQLQPHHQSGILIGPSLDYFEQAYFDAKSKAHNAGWARKPIVEMVISSTLDDTLAPPGQHVASLFCQQVAPEVDGGWDAHRDTVAKLMIDTVNDYAPNFARSVLGYEALRRSTWSALRPGRRRHLPRRAGPRPDVQRAPAAGPGAITAARSSSCTCAAPAPIRAAA